MSGIAAASAQIVACLRIWEAVAEGPIVVAVDGHGAAGKTTLATEAAAAVGAVLLHTDDFLHEAAETDDERPMARYYDWQRLRVEALEPALASSARVILVEGVSSATPALEDLVTHTVLVETAEAVRLERLRGRIAPEEWDDAWLAAERLYFASRPPESFDLVVSGATDDGLEPKITR
jgi:uridine kinase